MVGHVAGHAVGWRPAKPLTRSWRPGAALDAADAVGMTHATARKHYLDSKKAFKSQEVLRQHADKLRGAATG